MLEEIVLNTTWSPPPDPTPVIIGIYILLTLLLECSGLLLYVKIRRYKEVDLFDLTLAITFVNIISGFIGLILSIWLVYLA